MAEKAKILAPRFWTPTSKKLFLSVLSGLMLTASFPPAGLWWMAWIALVPLLKTLEDDTFSGAFKWGLAAGLAHYLSLIYWIVVVLGHYGGMGFAASTGAYLLLCLYLSLYPAFFAGIAARLTESRWTLIATPAVWVALEYGRAHLITGFPWCLLGYSQYGRLPLIQVADLSGVYGISFLVVLVNTLFYRLAFKVRGRGLASVSGETLFTALLLAATLAYGYLRLAEFTPETHPNRILKAAVVQADIDQSQKWDPAFQKETLKIYRRLTRSVYPFHPQLIVWPETAVPFFFQDNKDLSPIVAEIVDESGSALIFGSPAYGRTGPRIRYFNRAYLLTPDHQPPRYYDKVHLVPFGEYVPLKSLLFFIPRLVPAAGDFQAGDNIHPLKLNTLSAGVLICFEAIFPELARAQANAGAEILVNLTNDAWFGRTSAPYQHLTMALFRAVENHKPMIRAANTGFSAFIDARGRITQKSELFQEAVLEGRIQVRPSSPTFYARYGDLFSFFLLGLSAIQVFALYGKRRKKSK
jgi:apolipoprotein N-acyltransferase